MFLIDCPCCGARAVTEFTYVGDAGKRRPAEDAGDAAWHAYVYERDNPRGPHRELWQHLHGCRSLVEVTRDTVTHEISGTGLPGAGA